MNLRLMTAVAMCVAIGPAFASMGAAVGDNAQVSLADKQSFVTYETQVRTDLDQGVRYKEIAADKQAQVRDALDKMDQIWTHAGPDGQLNDNDKNEITNQLSLVSTILRHAAADSRLVCDRETPMGTNIAVNVCRTVAEIKREQDGSQESLRLTQEKGGQIGNKSGN